MTTPPATLGMLIAQRLCHDLVNPLGAIGNGLELLALSQPATPETALMRDSLDQALGRIKLYRLAFGQAGDAAETAGGDLAQALAALGGSRPLTLATDLPARMPRSDARLIALMGLCAETALAWGGTLTVSAGSGADAGTGSRGSLSVTAEAPRLRADPDIWAGLAAGCAPDAPTPPLVQFALLTLAVEDAGRSLAVSAAPTRIALTA